MKSSQHVGWLVACVGTIALSWIAGGCADSLAAGVGMPPQAILWKVEVAPHGLLMAVGEQQSLTVTARNILGDVMAIPDSVPASFVSLDPSRVTVSPDGIVHAVNVTRYNAQRGHTPVAIVVTWHNQEVTEADTAYVAVNAVAPPHPAAALSIHPAPYPADSAWAGWGSERYVFPTITTADGDVIPRGYAFVSTGERRLGYLLNDVVNSSSGTLSFFRPPGRFWVYAEASVYGVVLQDSVEYIEEDPIIQFIQLTGNPLGVGGMTILYNYEQLKDEVLYVAPCGQVIFANALSVPVTITFADTGATSVCVDGDSAGNIDTLAPQQAVIRKFRRAGAYSWTVTHLDGTPFRPAAIDTVHVRDYTAF